jgi:asparagine synthase (glutamine-hydrolysing)
MCGFTGVISKNQAHPETATFMQFAMSDLYRRGPDEQKIWVSDDKKASLGFARLAIRDLTSSGSQPMLSSDGSWAIMYNGETYNTDEIIAKAGIERHELNSTSDTEIILKSIVNVGLQKTISLMDGIFAIAAFNQLENKLYLVRDHLGVKPLYFGAQNEGAVFSSHYHHVVKHPYFSRCQINSDALISYFKYGFVQAGEGLFENTYLVPPSHIAEINLQTMQLKYTKFQFIGKLSNNDLGETIAQIISNQLVSDVPVGTFLSGGIDSAIVTAYASLVQKNILAFTIGVDDPKLDETALSKLTADKLAVNQYAHQITETDILSAIHQYDDSLAEPLADYSSLLTLKVCELAKKKLTVVLSGDGGDELFWGYPRMQNFRIYYPYLKRNKFFRGISIALARVRGEKIPFRLLKFNNAFDYYLSSQGLTGNKEWIPILLKYCNRKSKSFIENELRNIYNIDIDKWVKQTEMDIHLQRVLLKVDRASMYHSLEVRTPLLSPVMIAKSNEYSQLDCIKEGVGKLPLRVLLNNLLKLSQVTDSKKKGFEPPMALWMRTGLKKHIEDKLFNIPTSLKPYINQQGLQKLWFEHQSGKDHSWPIWAIYSLLSWLEKL